MVAWQNEKACGVAAQTAHPKTANLCRLGEYRTRTAGPGDRGSVLQVNPSRRSIIRLDETKKVAIPRMVRGWPRPLDYCSASVVLLAVQRAIPIHSLTYIA